VLWEESWARRAERKAPAVSYATSTVLDHAPAASVTACAEFARGAAGRPDVWAPVIVAARASGRPGFGLSRLAIAALAFGLCVGALGHPAIAHAVAAQTVVASR